MRARARDVGVGFGLPVALLAVLGWRLLRAVAVPGAGDHPSQLARAEVFRDAMAAGRDPLGFTFAFGGGIPDLQLYPPGVASLVWALADVAHLGTTTAYWAVVVLAWFAPAVAASATTAWVLGRERGATAATAVAGAAVGVLSFGYSGTRGGAAVGVLGSRLSVAAVILLFGLVVRATRASAIRASAIRAAAAGAPRVRTLVPIVLTGAAVGWFHGVFLPLAVVLVAVVVLLAGRDAVPPALASVAGLLASGWWWAGALALPGLATPIDRDPGSSALSVVVRPAFDASAGMGWWILVAVVVGAVAIVTRRSATEPESSASELDAELGGAGSAAGDERGALLRPWLLAVPAMAAAATLVASLLVRATGIAAAGSLDPVRVVDGLYATVALAAGLAVPALLRLCAASTGPLVRGLPAVAGALAIVWLGLQGAGLPSTAFAERLPEVEARGPDALWAVLRDGNGRVVYTSSLFEDTSAVSSLTFARTGREPLLGGPLQAQLQGGPGRTEMVGHADRYDDRSLFGITWAEMAATTARLDQVHRWLVELRVTTVVTERRPGRDGGQGPAPADVLGGAPGLFTHDATAGPFDVWTVRGAVSDIVAGDHVRLLPMPYWTAIGVGEASAEIVGTDAFGQAVVADGDPRPGWDPLADPRVTSAVVVVVDDGVPAPVGRARWGVEVLALVALAAAIGVQLGMSFRTGDEEDGDPPRGARPDATEVRQ